MKTALAVLVALVVIGCASTNKDEQCAQYKQAYEMYQASLLVRQPSEDEVKAAQVAAVFLTAYCGWSAATTDRGAAYDVNNVMIVTAP